MTETAICRHCDTEFDCPDSRQMRGGDSDPICEACWDDLDRREGEGSHAVERSTE